jgi:signal transduction histidine kinase
MRPTLESNLLHRTRRQLVLWSAGSTLIVLLALGGALYAAIASQLSGAGAEQLQERASVLQDIAERPLVRAGFRGPIDAGIAPDPSSPGYVFGGPFSGTTAVIVPPTLDLGSAVLFDPTGVMAARAGQTSIDEVDSAGTPLRVLSVPVTRAAGTYVLQVAEDRTSELRTLQISLLVLIVGGVAAVLAAGAIGWLYAGRALVPIRESLRRQREFAADASHELRTPLTVIKGNLRTLSGGSQTRSQQEALADIDGEVTRMTSLVEQLLLLARTDSDALELEVGRTDLAEEAADALEGFTPVANGKGVTLTLDVEPAPLNGDRFRLRQLVGILVDNAVRHAPTPGNVRVTVREAGGRATLSVEDDGPGIRPEDLPRVFDRFWRAPGAPEGGSGLGLAIAAWIVERHGGRIRAENQAAGGARFVAELPVG